LHLLLLLMLMLSEGSMPKWWWKNNFTALVIQIKKIKIIKFKKKEEDVSSSAFPFLVLVKKLMQSRHTEHFTVLVKEGGLEGEGG